MLSFLYKISGVNQLLFLLSNLLWWLPLFLVSSQIHVLQLDIFRELLLEIIIEASASRKHRFLLNFQAQLMIIRFWLDLIREFLIHGSSSYIFDFLFFC